MSAEENKAAQRRIIEEVINRKDLDLADELLPRKGERMKKLVLLSVFALMLASAVFAPVALAKEPAEVDVRSVTRGPGGSVTVTGTIGCIEGYIYDATVEVSQRTSRDVYNTVRVYASGTCEGPTGRQGFTATGYSDRPFRREAATIQAIGTLYDPGSSDNINWAGEEERVRIR